MWHGPHVAVITPSRQAQSNQHGFERLTLFGWATASIASVAGRSRHAVEQRAESVECVHRSGRRHPVGVEYAVAEGEAPQVFHRQGANRARERVLIGDG